MCFHVILHFQQLDPGNFGPFVPKVSRALRILTQSLFPSFQLAVFPLPGASWTATRLLAGEDSGGMLPGLDGEAAYWNHKGEGPLMYDPVLII